MTEKEIWKDVVGFEGLYKVSNKGNIYSVERISTNNRKFGGITLKPRYDKDGYFRVTLCKNGKQNTRFIHRLVLEAFVPNPNNFLEVNHLDEYKTNNKLSNLEWCDTRYNINYGERTKKVTKKLSKRIRAINIKTGEILTFSSTKEAGSEGYFDASRACRGIYGRSGHLYKGHTWSYV